MREVLDPTAGARMFYFDKEDHRVLFTDNREVEEVLCDGREFAVNPDLVVDFRNMHFIDNSFHMVVFDPPHLLNVGDKSWLAKKYGRLDRDNWREDIRQGFSECFRVLKPNGVLIFKWNETDIKVSEILALTPEKPLLGNRSGKAAKTHWIVFMKAGS